MESMEPVHVQQVPGLDAAPQPTVDSSPSQVSEVSTPDKNDSVLSKPTFKSALQAKKRLQAYRSGSLPSSPLAKKLKIDEKALEKADKPLPKKVKDPFPDEKAKAVIEEIEEIKRTECTNHLESQRSENSRRSRSRSDDKERFKRVEKRSRNYRKRSMTPADKWRPAKKVDVEKKPIKKYPTDWMEFEELDLTFAAIRTMQTFTRGCTEMSRQLLFKGGSLPINEFTMKTVDREDRVVPFKYIRYTQQQPTVAFSVNCTAIKESCLTRREVFEVVPREIIANIEKLHYDSVTFKTDALPMSKSRCWFPKTWRFDDCRLLETSMGLSFLQSYNADGGDEEIVEEEVVIEDRRKEPEGTKTPECQPTDKKKEKKKPKHSDDDNVAEEVLVKKKKKSKRKSTDDEIDVKKKTKKRKKDKMKKEKIKKEKNKKKLKESNSEEKSEIFVKEDKVKKEPKTDLKKEKSPLVEKEDKRKKSKSREREDSRKRKLENDKTDTKKSRKSEECETKMEPKKEDTIITERNRSKTPKIEKERRKSKDKCSKTPEMKKSDRRVKKSKRSKSKSSTSVGAGKEGTPDTDEYHSHWESDEDISTVPIPRPVTQKPLKSHRSWESDEELFERTYKGATSHPNTYEKLEMPLTINSFGRKRSSTSTKHSKWDSKPAYVDVETEMKLLEEERRSLTEERRKLEIEKAQVLKLQEESNRELANSSSTPIDFDLNRVKSEKSDTVTDFTDSMNNSLLSNVSSLESVNNFPALENEYEEFMKALNTEAPPIVVQPQPVNSPDKLSKKKKPKAVSSNDDSSSSSSSSSDSNSKKKRKKKKLKKKRRNVKSIFDEFDIPVPSDLPDADVIGENPPLPVPSPTVLPLTCTVASSSLVLETVLRDLDKTLEKLPGTPPLINDGLDLSKPFVFPTITISPKKPALVDNSKLKLDDDSDSADFTEKFVKKPDEVDTKTIEVPVINVEKPVEVTKPPEIKEPPVKEPIKEPVIIKEPPKVTEEVKVPSKVTSDRAGDRDVKKKKDPRRRSSPARKRDSPAPVRRRQSPRRRSSPPPPPPSSRRRRSPSLRRRSPVSPRRRSPGSPRRRSLSPRRRSITPRRRSLSPRRRSPPRGPRRYRGSPRRSPSPCGLRRSQSPRARGCDRKRSPSPRRRGRDRSPLHSPLDGFKRSVADSTISDDMLPQPSPKDYSESPPTFRNSKYYPGSGRRRSPSPTSSPKRVSLDDRINQVLGLEQKAGHHHHGHHHHHHQHHLGAADATAYHHQHYNYPPPPPSSSSSSQYDQYGPYNHYGQYVGQVGQKSEYVPGQFAFPPPAQQQSVKQASTKVVQIGNILQVVPSDELPQTPIVSTNNKMAEVTQKIVQVGNMLQIVPAPIAAKLPVIEQPAVVVMTPEKQSAEAALKQRNAERKAEREKRRSDRERRRKDKEKKRKEKDRRKQIKLKMKTENMIKKALQLDSMTTKDGDEDGDEVSINQFPQVQLVVSPNGSSTKGILIAGKSDKKASIKIDKKKSVQFADGIRPGEGTSPSGGEELSSPPPMSKLPKEKRFKKMKIPKKSKKKKIKVKVIKRAPIEDVGDDDEDDDLPPPSPPPGSPPPHVFPSRVKTHTINNVHQYVVSGPGAYVQQFRPPMSPMPVVINRGAPSAFLPGAFHPEVHNLPHPSHHATYPGGLTRHGVSSHH